MLRIDAGPTEARGVGEYLPRVLTASELADLLRLPLDQKTRRAEVRELVSRGAIRPITPTDRFASMRFSRIRVLEFIDGEVA